MSYRQPNWHLYDHVQQSAHTKQQNITALQKSKDTSVQCNYDHMFETIPICHGSKDMNTLNG